VTALDPYLFSELPNHRFDGFAQIVIETSDLDAAVREYADKLGVGPWWVGPLEPPSVQNTTYYGKPEPMRVQVGIAFVGEMQLLLVEPRDGKNIYKDFLEQRGGGIHYLTFTHSGHSFDEMTKELEARGYESITTGGFLRNRWWNFLAGGPNPVTYEVLEWPEDQGLPEPDYWYPPKEGS